MIRLLNKLILCALVLSSGATLSACRKPVSTTATQAASAPKPEPQPSVCKAENVSRAALLRATPTPPPQSSPR
jgi:hypothetical protein